MELEGYLKGRCQPQTYMAIPTPNIEVYAGECPTFTYQQQLERGTKHREEVLSREVIRECDGRGELRSMAGAEVGDGAKGL